MTLSPTGVVSSLRGGIDLVRRAPTPFTRAQRDGVACIHCGDGGGVLAPDGHVWIPGLPGLGWAVVAHPTCRTGPIPQEES